MRLRRGSGDEEYRSEETLTQLGRILAKRHGFHCTVLYAIDPKDGTINPNQNDNIPGLEALKTAGKVRDMYMKDGERIIITAGVPIGAPGTTNMVRIASVGPEGEADI